MTTQTVSRPASLAEWQERTQLMGPLLAESLERGLTYQAQSSDLFIAPFAKCGAYWLQQLVHGLRSQGDMNLDDVSQVIPWVEMAHYAGLDLAAPQPGDFHAFKSHLSWTKIPKGGRYIVSCRDPKEALVALYNFVNGCWWETNSVSLTEFARAFYLKYQGDHWDGSYWGHLVSWWEQRHNPNVLLLSYEGMKADLPTTVETIAHFLAIALDQDLLNRVLKQASLEFMPALKSKVSDPSYQAEAAKQRYAPRSETPVKVKDDRVGDHRPQLPTEIGAAMDAIWQETVAAKTGLASYRALAEALACGTGDV